jgi:YidC/Oxa1 family membrane protein insertase
MNSAVDIKNLVIAFALSVAIVFVWQIFFPQPVPTPPAVVEQSAQTHDTAPITTPSTAPSITAPLRSNTLEEALTNAPRLPIQDSLVHGSLPLVGKGLRLDNLTLAEYRTSLDPESQEVTLLRPSNMAQGYFAEFGWTSGQNNLTLPDANTRWKVNQESLDAASPVSLRWTNPQGVVFTIMVQLKDDYLFEITRTVENRSGQDIQLRPYALINREYIRQDEQYAILHEGPFGVFNETLEEVDYDSLKDKKQQRFDSTGSWAGISDKYWFTALLPNQSETRTIQMRHYERQGFDRYQVDYSQDAIALNAGATHSSTAHFFAGPKKLSMLDRYGKELNLPLFDRAVDFGALYFMTRPLFEILQAIYQWVGNFGIAIMILTVFIRILLFPLANKSYKAMAQMRKLHPKMMEIRERHEDDRMQMQQEIMSLYRKEKVNPVSGCLPLLIQIPIFFALYKVLFCDD